MRIDVEFAKQERAKKSAKFAAKLREASVRVTNIKQLFVVTNSIDTKYVYVNEDMTCIRTEPYYR